MTDNKFKILFLSESPAPYQIDFINKAQSVFQLSGYFLWNRQKNRDWDIDSEYIEIADFRYSPSAYIKFTKHLLDFDPEVIIVGGYSLPLSFLAFLYAKIKKRKFVYWLERPLPASGIKKKIKNLYIRARLFKCDYILAIGKKAHNLYKKIHIKVHNFPYTMNLDEYLRTNRVLKKENEKMKFLFVGQYIERKGIAELLQAFSSLDNNLIELHLAGSGQLQTLVHQHCQNDTRIKDHGFVQPHDLPQVYAQCDVFILPSKHDGWAVVVTEAMAAAMPIIGTKYTGAFVEFCAHKENAYCCEVHPQSIANAINYYADNYDLVHSHGTRSRHIIKDSVANVDRAVPELEQIIKMNG